MISWKWIFYSIYAWFRFKPGLNLFIERDFNFFFFVYGEFKYCSYLKKLDLCTEFWWVSTWGLIQFTAVFRIVLAGDFNLYRKLMFVCATSQVELSSLKFKSIKCSIAVKSVKARFTCSMADARGMNMVSKGIQTSYRS